MLVVLSLVQGVDDLSDACRDISDSAATFDGVVHSLLSIVLSDRSRLSVIDTRRFWMVSRLSSLRPLSSPRFSRRWMSSSSAT